MNPRHPTNVSTSQEFFFLSLTSPHILLSASGLPSLMTHSGTLDSTRKSNLGAGGVLGRDELGRGLIIHFGCAGILPQGLILISLQ